MEAERAQPLQAGEYQKAWPSRLATRLPLSVNCNHNLLIPIDEFNGEQIYLLRCVLCDRLLMAPFWRVELVPGIDELIWRWRNYAAPRIG